MQENENTVNVVGKIKYNFKPIRMFFFLTVALSVLVIALRTVSLYSCYDASLGLYDNGAVLPVIVNIVTVVSLIVIAGFPFVVDKNAKLPINLPKVGRFITFASSLCGFTLLITLVFQFIVGVDFMGVSMLSAGLKLVMLISSVPAAMYFLVIAVKDSPKKNIMALLGFFPTLWTALYLMCVYFDKSSVIANPVRIMTQLSLIAAMVYFLFELRFLVGRARPRYYLTFANVALFLCSVSCVPKLIASIPMKWQMTPEIVCGIVEMSFVVYIIARVCSFKRVKGIKLASDVALKKAQDQSANNEKTKVEE